MKVHRILPVFILFLSGLPGIAQEVLEVIPYDSNAWTFFRGRSQPSADWNKLSFDDGDWETGMAPFGYGSAEAAYINTLISDMQNNYVSAYFRFVFEIDDTYPLESMTMEAKYDDGFVAYLNGNRIAYRGLTIANPPYNITATDHEFTGSGESISIGAQAMSYLQPGLNVFAIQAHNTSLTSSDLFMDVNLRIQSQQSPFACVSGFQCVDKGDSIVEFSWNYPQGVFLDMIEIREDGEVIHEAAGDVDQVLVDGIEPGDHLYRIFGKKTANPDEECYGGICTVTVSPIIFFIRGDVNDDAKVNIIDPLFLAHYLFQNGVEPTCLDTCDANDDGTVNIADITSILSYLFQSGDVLPAPGPVECGPDEVLDELPVCIYTSCQ